MLFSLIVALLAVSSESFAYEFTAAPLGCAFSMKYELITSETVSANGDLSGYNNSLHFSITLPVSVYTTVHAHYIIRDDIRFTDHPDKPVQFVYSNVEQCSTGNVKESDFYFYFLIVNPLPYDSVEPDYQWDDDTQCNLYMNNVPRTRVTDTVLAFCVNKDNRVVGISFKRSGTTYNFTLSSYEMNADRKDFSITPNTIASTTCEDYTDVTNPVKKVDDCGSSSSSTSPSTSSTSPSTSSTSPSNPHSSAPFFASCFTLVIIMNLVTGYTLF